MAVYTIPDSSSNEERCRLNTPLQSNNAKPFLFVSREKRDPGNRRKLRPCDIVVHPMARMLLLLFWP
jgi:hypothetical protein